MNCGCPCTRTEYILTKNVDRIPISLSRYELNGWHLAYSANLHVTAVRMRDRMIGAVLGNLKQADSAVVCATADIEEISKFLYGSYCCIVHDKNAIRVFLDPSGSLPIVFSKEQGIIASSPGLIVELPYDEESKALAASEDYYFPFGITSKPGVSRLLPNHELQTADWSVRRIRRVLPGKYSCSDSENIDAIIEMMEAVIQRAEALGPFALGLTAGHDSRAIASVLSYNRHSFMTFTSKIDKAGEWDCEIASKIAATLGAPHQALAFSAPSSEQRLEWLDSTGFCVGGRVSYNFRTIAAATTDKVVISGLAGEVGRCFYRSRRTGSLNAKDILSCLGLRYAERILPAAEAWLGDLHDMDSRSILDLMYIEVRLGCWAGPQLVAMGASATRLLPFVHLEIFERMLSIPPDKRAANFIAREIVHRCAPNIARYPHVQMQRGNMARRILRRLGITRCPT